MPGRRGQKTLGLVIDQVFLGVEDGEMLSDDVFRRIPLQTLGAGIPTDHVAHRIQLEDGVFLNSLNELARALLAIPEDSFRKLTICNVFKCYSQEITGKWKDSHRINAIPYALVTIRNLSQIRDTNRGWFGLAVKSQNLLPELLARQSCEPS